MFWVESTKQSKQKINVVLYSNVENERIRVIRGEIGEKFYFFEWKWKCESEKRRWFEKTCLTRDALRVSDESSQGDKLEIKLTSSWNVEWEAFKFHADSHLNKWKIMMKFKLWNSFFQFERDKVDEKWEIDFYLSFVEIFFIIKNVYPIQQYNV